LGFAGSAENAAVGMAEGAQALNTKEGKMKDDPLRDNAERLVPSANVYAISLFIPTLDQFPWLRKVEPGQWDFVVTIASVFMAATRLQNLKIGDVRQQELMNIVARGLVHWDPNNGIRGFEDCKAMFERTFDGLTNDAQHEPRFIASDSVGLWTVWNLLGRTPEAEEERKLVRTIGAHITHTFFSWWTQ